MNQAVHTYSDIVISPYQFEKILSLKITQELNEHTRLSICGIIPEEKVDQYVENADDNERIQVVIRSGDSMRTLFQGVVTNMAVNAAMNVRNITIEALSSTFLMDIRKKSRSYQNKNLTYDEIFTRITREYADSDAINEAIKGKTVPGLLVQYNETDWEFVKRLASHFNVPLAPVCRLDGIKYYIGAPAQSSSYTLDGFNYVMKKDLKGYRIKSENDIQDIHEQNLISYEVTSNKILDLCSPVEFKKRTLYVYRAETVIENGIMVNNYILRDLKGLSRRKIVNRSLAGTSLFGKVLDVAKDMVKVHLEIDPEQSVQEALWFSYSTVYSSPDGTGWYCMPEIGDQVRLYFPDENEKNAFAASSVNLESSDPQKRSDPSVKSISTKYGKQIVFQPGAIEIIGSGKLLMRLTDEGGIEINSDKKIVLTASDDIEIHGGSKVLIQGEGGVDLKQANANLKILDNVTISGARVNIE